MEFLETELNGAVLIKPDVYGDSRGFFMESYNREKFVKGGIETVFLQDNYSKSETMYTLRGLHFQRPPFAQAKLIRVNIGSVYDVIVDLRKDSPTYRKWQGFTLSDENFLMLYVPEGFAHGFVTLEKGVHFQYKVSNFYSKEHDSGIRYDDPEFNIDWPAQDFLLSEKDRQLPYFTDIPGYF
ncbi:MAG: dTDP-4-dehydrorhamnose 3,5-epimerase [Chitinivibrionales bacterium]